jgi:hypothetical protein
MAWYDYNNVTGDGMIVFLILINVVMALWSLYILLLFLRERAEKGALKLQEEYNEREFR